MHTNKGITVAFEDESKLGTPDVRVKISLGGNELLLNFDDVSQLIKLLGRARSGFPEAIQPKELSPQEVFIFQEDPAIAIAPAEGGHNPQLYIHHACVGWVLFRVSPQWLETLNQLYQNQASVSPAVAH